MAKTILTTWEVWGYDVWGNSADGYDVNNRSCEHRDYSLRLKVKVNNPGLSSEFNSAYPSDYQLQNVFGIRCKLDTYGDDISIYINRESDGYPLGEMFCTSHESLSPIRAKA